MPSASDENMWSMSSSTWSMPMSIPEEVQVFFYGCWCCVISTSRIFLGYQPEHTTARIESEGQEAVELI